EIAAPHHLVKQVASLGRLPVVTFVAGGIATPADAAMMMQLGDDGVFVGSGIFTSGDPEARAKAIVEATTHFDDPTAVAKASRGLAEAIAGINVADVPAPHRLAERGWLESASSPSREPSVSTCSCSAPWGSIPGR